MLDGRWAPGHLNELSAQECWDLLATHEVGRVGFCDGRGAVMLPVNYTVHDRSVLFRTSPDGLLGQHLRWGYAAFEVDEFDDYTQSGWSVLVRGPSRAADPGELPETDEARPVPWAAGDRSLVLRVTPDQVTGRRVMPS
ncbi:pyridoxamine 5'-phosphate oxidase family protein [Nocardioides mesophilus]|uniref:Pyridoxamine 5'-phosphate oxidase family protein n=1 Tax=Nocardioides mesophilus TaxID=433659 RepID=A0A7G9R8F4_9ACTN|nr:pyridoxamine 5'-phosphate oxidase family protein [Nocardioides mesophilus]QNN51879.1 pyridoxamine 5'-phosphate oxidase family protein [Nocardioides mesophilus]